MIGVWVEHFLNSEGKAYFSQWIQQIKTPLSKFEGYVDIQELRDVEHQDRSLLYLRFESLEQLRTWARSEVHEFELAKLRPFMEKKPKSQIFEMLSSS